MVKASNKNAPPVGRLDLPPLDGGPIKTITVDLVNYIFFNIISQFRNTLVGDTFSAQDHSDPT